MESTGWCMPSEPLFDAFAKVSPDGWGDAALPPKACKGPHQWEKFAVLDSACDCGLCGSGEFRDVWMECANCYESWYEDGTQLFAEMLTIAPWG